MYGRNDDAGAGSSASHCLRISPRLHGSGGVRSAISKIALLAVSFDGVLDVDLLLGPSTVLLDMPFFSFFRGVVEPRYLSRCRDVHFHEKFLKIQVLQVSALDALAPQGMPKQQSSEAQPH